MGIIKERAKLNRAIRNAKTIFLMAHKNTVFLVKRILIYGIMSNGVKNILNQIFQANSIQIHYANLKSVYQRSY